ncbi:DUF262 domain-containing protein [Corynebacterium sp. MSK035]|uniref:GmrSD restriction endonuclease domain-containing protein n=1 Tax=Corynebacterium sp. MSK035 TaxID=3050192 RepID=UPI00254F44DB|nr:DUF262 domain-containing protein [Corynebacterium sp. MSK035]MDK8811151.1 DUF262 domain-containing protein [Corynebacterium sp. MSK035]
MVAAQETILQDVLEGTKQYIVPLYQRPYQWGKAQLQDLWNDIIELTEDRQEGDRSSHFIGSLVLAPPPVSVAGGVATFLVVDGQQRLTTLTLLLAAIRDYRDEKEPEAEAGIEIHNRFLVNQYKKGSQHIKLVPTQADRASYAAVIRKLPHLGGTDRIGEAYRFFRTQLEKIDDPEDPNDIANIQDAIVEGLSLVSISTHPQDNVHRIFQSLNNTGLKLTQGDLLRNYIFMRLPENGDDAYDRYWKPLQERLSNDEIESLFWVDIASENPRAKISDTFVLQQKRMDSMHTESEILTELKRFTELSRLYQKILAPENEENSSVRYRLQRLREWDATTTHALMLTLLTMRENGVIDSQDLAQTLLVIESYIVRRFLSGRPTQGLNRVFREAAGIFEPNEPAAIQLRRWLSTGRKHFYPDDALRASIKELPYYLNGRRAHRPLFLRWLEQEFGSREPVDTSELSIEHVMPQNLSPEWRADLSAWYPGVDIDEMHNTWKHTLGNLTLTGYNSQLSNKGFAWKREELARSGLRLSTSLIDSERWGPDEIAARADSLTDLIIKAWPGPTTGDFSSESENPKWRKLKEILVAIPTGRWTSYGEIAAAIGSAPQPVGTYIANNVLPNAYRVMRASGEIPEGFRWYDESDTRNPQELLASEGIEFSASGHASRAQFLDAEDLSELLEIPDATV